MLPRISRCLVSCLIAMLALIACGHLSPANADGSWITFLSHRSGKNQLYRMRPDGTELESVFGDRIDNAPAVPMNCYLYQEPHWTRLSPNGSLFLCWSCVTGMPEDKYATQGQFMLHLSTIDGAKRRIIEPAASEVFAWAPTSDRFAFAVHYHANSRASYVRAAPPTSEICLLDIDGTNRTVVLDKPGLWSVSDWSPNGQRLLLTYTSDKLSRQASFNTDQLLELDVASFSREAKELRLLGLPYSDLVSSQVNRYLRSLPLKAGRRLLGPPRYSPGGNRIALTWERFPSDRVDEPLFEVVTLDLESGKSRVVLSSNARFHGPICWSPDETEILFARPLAPSAAVESEKMEGGLEIVAVDLANNQQRSVTTGWSPDWR